MRLLTTAASLELGRGGRLGLARPLAASSFLRAHVRVEVPLALNSPRTVRVASLGFAQAVLQYWVPTIPMWRDKPSRQRL